MSTLSQFQNIEGGIGIDAGGRRRVSMFTTLFDGKTLNSDNSNLWHGAGDGTVTWANNKTTLSVTSGKWYVRQSNRFLPYFSGKSQFIEMTCENFQPEVNVIKRLGYFSSSAVSPYTAAQDGFYIETDGSTHWLVIMNDGTQILKKEWTEWTNYAQIADYNFTGFNVFAFDFLWLGGAVLNVYLKTQDGFVLCHTYTHVGSAGTMFRSPNQPLRYEIRSSTGTGSFTQICSQVSTEGSVDESGDCYGLYSGSLINVNQASTIYVIKSLKKQITYRDIAIKIVSFGAIYGTASDQGVLLLIKDPTLTGGSMVYANNGIIQEGTPTGVVTANANTGKVLAAIPLSSNAQYQVFEGNNNAWLQNKIDGTLSEYVFAFMPYSSTATVGVTVGIKTY